MQDKDFLKLVSYGKLDETREYLDSHDINYVFDLLVQNNSFYVGTFNYINNYYNKEINPKVSKKLVNKRILDLTDLPEYMYKNELYFDDLFLNRTYTLEERYKIIDKFLMYNTLNEKVLKTIIGTNEIDDNYNIEIYSNIKYTKVLATLSYYNGYHFKSSGINDEVVDILYSNGFCYNGNSSRINCDLYKYFYFVLKELSTSRYEDIFKYVNSHYDRYSEEELFKILEVTTKQYPNNAYFEFINRDIRFINYWLENGSSQTGYVHRISKDILTDENNGVVKKLIDLGLNITSDTNPIILNSEVYINYKLDKDINEKKNLYWIQYIGSDLLNNPSNGIIYRALENGCVFFDIFFNNIEYVLKYFERDKIESSFYNKIPKNIINDPSNNVIKTMIDKDFFAFQLGNELFSIKEYVLYFINNKADSYSIKDVVNNCNVEFLFENDLFKKCVDIGYEITNKTPKEILDNEDYLYYYFDYCMINNTHNSQYDFARIFEMMSDEIIGNPSNGIIMNIIRKGFTYYKSMDRRIINNREYVACFLENQNAYNNNELLNNLNNSLLNDRDLIIPCIEDGYRYTENTPSALFQIDYLKKYFAYYNESNESNPLWTTINHRIIPRLSKEIISDPSNGLIYTAFDYGFEINHLTDSHILNNTDYLLYYLRNHKRNVSYLLKSIDQNLLKNKEFVYSLFDIGYILESDSPGEIINNYDYVLYALTYGKVSENIKLPESIIDEKMAYLLLKNKVKIFDLKRNIYEEYNLKDLRLISCDYLYDATKCDVVDFLKKNKEFTLDDVPKSLLNDKFNIMALIFYNSNVIDIVDINILDKDLITLALLHDYVINSKELLTKYINIVGLKEVIKYNSNIIEIYSELEFKELFNQDYEEILIYSFENGYDISKNVASISPNLNNKIFIKLAIEYNNVDIINNIKFPLDKQLFEEIWTKKVNINGLSENIKVQVINNLELFNIVMKSSNKRLVQSISLFYPNNIDNKNIDILFDKVLLGYKISDRELFKNNLKYVYSKNKELFYDLNIEIFTDKYLFLGIETINRIIPDKNIVYNVTKLPENKLKVFNLCINYLYSIDIDINVNDILYILLNNLDSNYTDLCENIVEVFVNYDKLLDNIKNGKTNGRNIVFFDNLVNILCLPNNIYNFKLISEINDYTAMKKKFFESLNPTDDIKNIKNRILYKYYNIGLETADFIYKRYCYIKEDIAKLEDVKLRKILYDIVFLIECDDIDSLLNIYNNISIESVDFRYSIMLEGLLRNEYVKQFEEKLNDNKFNKIDDNIYEAEDDINIFVHVLGAYSKYIEPNNFEEEWNIELMTNHGVCTSYITNQYLALARNVNFPTLVFTEIEPNSLLLSSPDDISSRGMNEKFATSLMRPCCFLSPDTMIDESRWQHNEIVLERKYLDSKSSISYKRQPNYILYVIENGYLNEDESINWEKIKNTELWRMTEKASKDFGIPVLVINRLKVNKKERDTIDAMKQEMLSTNNYLLLNKIIVRYINNLTSDSSIIKPSDLYDFIDNMISLAFQVENGKLILDTIYYTILEENRKFKDHRTDEKFNFIKKYETILSDKIREYNSSLNDDKIVKM